MWAREKSVKAEKRDRNAEREKRLYTFFSRSHSVSIFSLKMRVSSKELFSTLKKCLSPITIRSWSEVAQRWKLPTYRKGSKFQTTTRKVFKSKLQTEIKFKHWIECQVLNARTVPSVSLRLTQKREQIPNYYSESVQKQIANWNKVQTLDRMPGFECTNGTVSFFAINAICDDFCDADLQP